MNCLIVGAGIAGPSLAYWLLHYGHHVTLIERAPRLRTGGYVIDFWGAGFDVAERMNLVPEVRARGYMVKDIRLVGPRGQTVGGFSAEIFDKLAAGRYVSLPRGDLAEAIFAKVDGRIETIFGDEVVGLNDTGAAVEVTFAHAAPRTFDMVVGADGLHSKVRELAFGPQIEYEKYLGYRVAAFEIAGYRPRDEGVYIMHTEIGRQVARFAMRGDKSMFLFVYADADGSGAMPENVEGKKALLRERFATTEWEAPAILKAMDASSEIYMDRVSQIRMPSWAKGRIALLGDAAYCVSLLGGQGSALAMVGAYVLAGELSRESNPVAAFGRYQERLRPFLAKKQQSAEGFASSFAPRSAFGLSIRNAITGLLRIPLIARLAIGRSLMDAIELPTYEERG